MTTKDEKKEAKSKTYLTNDNKELDEFITDNFNNEIYQDLIGAYKPLMLLTTPLEFFQELYSDFNWILENKHKPRAITEHFQKKPFLIRTYYLKKLEELLKRKLEGKDKTYEKRLLDIVNNYSQSKEYKQLEDAKENIEKIRRNEEKDITVRYIQHNFVDEVRKKMESLPELEKEQYLRNKAAEFFQLPKDDRETYERHKNFNLTNWYRRNLEVRNELELRDQKKKIMQLEQIAVNEKKIQDYPPTYRKRIIDAAVRLSEKKDKWKDLDLVEELNISKSTLDRQKRFFGLKMSLIRDEAQAIIREKEK